MVHVYASVHDYIVSVRLQLRSFNMSRVMTCPSYPLARYKQQLFEGSFGLPYVI